MMGFRFSMTSRLSFIALALTLVLLVLVFLIGFKLGGMLSLESGTPMRQLVMPDGGGILRPQNIVGSESSAGGVPNHSSSDVGGSGGQVNFPKKPN
jgi:hypothetical protein